MPTPTQLKLGIEDIEEIQTEEKPELANGRINKLSAEDRAFRDWYRFVLSFPPHLVQEKGDHVLQLLELVEFNNFQTLLPRIQIKHAPVRPGAPPYKIIFV